jgi:chitinase
MSQAQIESDPIIEERLDTYIRACKSSASKALSQVTIRASLFNIALKDNNSNYNKVTLNYIKIRRRAHLKLIKKYASVYKAEIKELHIYQLVKRNRLYSVTKGQLESMVNY